MEEIKCIHKSCTDCVFYQALGDYCWYHKISLPWDLENINTDCSHFFDIEEAIKYVDKRDEKGNNKEEE